MRNELYTPNPFHVPKVWGGERLARIFDDNSGEKLGESWIVSRHKDGPSLVNEEGLDKFVNKEELPYLIKLLDTSDNLSIQVHPNDDYAIKNENSSGKTECWLILDAKPGSGIFLGLKEGVTKEDLSTALKNKEYIADYLNFFPVNKFDFFLVPAGTIHAIGKDVFLAEIQQSSGITYRVWDWDRLDDLGKSRKLHVKQALDVISFVKEENIPSYFRHKKEKDFSGKSNFLTKFKDFKINLYQEMNTGILTSSEDERFQSILLLEGELKTTGDREIKLRPYETLLFPATTKLEFECIQNTKFLHIY